MKHIKLAFILLTIMIVLGNCTFKNRTTTTKMCLEDLDMKQENIIGSIIVLHDLLLLQPKKSYSLWNII